MDDLGKKMSLICQYLTWARKTGEIWYGHKWADQPFDDPDFDTKLERIKNLFRQAYDKGKNE